jgi:hypothetical protein
MIDFEVTRRNLLTGGIAALGSCLWLPSHTLGKTTARTRGLIQAPGALIEVGSSGIKVSVYNFSVDRLPDEDSPTASGFQRFAPRRTASFDTNPFPLKPENVEATAEAVARFMDRLVKESRIERERIFVFGSSGIATQSHAGYLATAINEKTGYKIEFVDAAKESELGFKWVVLGHRRREVVFIDIGSGNSKGGYLERVGSTSENFQYFSVPFGTKSFAEEARKSHPQSPLYEALTVTRRDALDPLFEGITGRQPAVINRPRAYMVGGIVWAVATLVKPNTMIEQPRWVPLTPADFAELQTRVDAGIAFQPNLTRNATDSQRTWLQKQVDSVSEVFKPNQLVAGAEICRAFSDHFEFNKKKGIFFATFSIDGWSSQYLMEKLKLAA